MTNLQQRYRELQQDRMYRGRAGEIAVDYFLVQAGLVRYTANSAEPEEDATITITAQAEEIIGSDSVVVKGEEYPPCVDAPTTSIAPKRMDDNSGCTGREAGSTYTNFDPAMNDNKLLLDVSVCTDPVTKKARVQLSKVDIAILYGRCRNGLPANAQQLKTVSDITETNACEVKRELELRKKQLEDGADEPNTNNKYYTEDEILNHEETHVKQEQQYMEQALAKVNEQLKEIPISKETLADISKNGDKRLIFANTVIFDKLKEAYKYYSPAKGEPGYLENELVCERNQADTLKGWLEAANSKCK